MVTFGTADTSGIPVTGATAGAAAEAVEGTGAEAAAGIVDTHPEKADTTAKGTV